MSESPYNKTFNRFNSNNIDLKRNSLQITSFHKLSNKVVNKFESSTNPKEETSKKSSNNSTNKLININDFIIKSERNNSFERRNTAISVLNNNNKDLSDFNSKKLKFKIIANNEILSSLKEKEENSLYSSKSSSEEKSKPDVQKKDKKIKNPLDMKSNIQKSEYIIKEEDENNMSEITEDYNKKRTSIINKKNSIIISIQNTQGNKAINTEEKTQIEKENKKKEEDNKKEVKEIEINTDENIDNKESTINTNRNKINKKSNNDKIENKKEKSNILLTNKNELKEKMKKENERNNTISVVSINEMFMNQNINNRQKQIINSSKNYLYAITLENNYIKQNKASGNGSLKNKSNPSLLPNPKINRIRINSSSIKNIEQLNLNNKLTISKNLDKLDSENNNYFEKINQPYKTFSNFSKLGIERNEKKIHLNSKKIILQNKDKKLNEVANNFLNKKINTKIK